MKVWEELNPDCSKFFQKYLNEYPEVGSDILLSLLLFYVLICVLSLK